LIPTRASGRGNERNEHVRRSIAAGPITFV
jgi:hypothetical protein